MENCIDSMRNTHPISETTTFDILQSSDEMKMKIEINDDEVNGFPIMTCIFCNAAFLSLDGLAEHMRRHTLPDKVEMDLEETDIENVDTGSVTPSERLPKFHVCSECGRSFSLACNLKTHIRTHRGERPFQCAECDKCFTSKVNMQTHSRTHSNTRPFSCLQCDRKFTQIGSLKVHMLTHTGERPFGCEVCIRQFTKASDLRRHAKTHASEKPFKCDHCTKTFLNSTSLNMHSRRHSNFRPYSCFVCDKKFTRVVCLKNHVKLHSLSGRHSCVENVTIHQDGSVIDAGADNVSIQSFVISERCTVDKIESV